MDPVFQRLRSYFQGLADALAKEREASAVFPNTSDLGSTREDLLVKFLTLHLPSMCTVCKGGFIFDLHQQESSQIDVIVAANDVLQFRQFDKAFAYSDGCLAAISVKSHLDGNQLRDALENLASIPPWNTPLSVPFLKTPPGFIEELPLRMVFAFSAVSNDSLLEHYNAFVDAHHELPGWRRPKLIVVNKQLVVEHLGGGEGKTTDGETLKAFSAVVSHGHPYLGAYGLIRMIANIQRVAAVVPLRLHSFSRYYERLSEVFAAPS